MMMMMMMMMMKKKKKKKKKGQLCPCGITERVRFFRPWSLSAWRCGSSGQQLGTVTA
jgi:hypothetical protein